MKYVYSFKEGNKDMRNILGGKGANLCEMAKIGLPVPNGFIVSTDACNNYYENNKELNDEIIKEINEKLEELEKKMEQLKAQKKAIQAKQSKLERAQRTRRLIENGALAEKYLRCEKVEPADFEKLLQKLVTIDTVKTIIKGNVNE